MAFEDELRLAYAVAINAFVLACAYRFVRARVGGDIVQRLIDTFLLYYAVQYCSVMLPGLLGALHPFSIAAVAGWLGVSLLTGAHFLRLPPEAQAEINVPPLRPLDAYVTLACGAFVIVFLGALVHQQRYLPPFATDALTYHLPAAVQWLQTGLVGLFETWFFNPANTYSPLGGSTFIAWLMAPMGNHALVRFVQVGPLLMLFLLLVEVGRALGATTAAAAVVAAGAVLSRPFVSQAIVPKDDLFVTVFAVAGLLALCGPRAGGRFAAWRACGAIGLLLAMKYTVLFAAPILLLAIPRHRRENRDGDGFSSGISREKLKENRDGDGFFFWIVLGTALVLAGPWYVRNVWLTGNPLFPMDVRIGSWHAMHGMFATARSEELQTLAGAAHVLMGGYYSVPPILAGMLAGGWLVLIVRRGRDVLRLPLLRACVLGTLLSIVMFLAAAPFGEVRFLYPAIALLAACFAAAAANGARPALSLVPAGLFAVVALLTCGFPTEDKVTFSLAGTAAVAIVVAAQFALRRHRRRARVGLALAGVTAALVAMGFTYVNWRVYLEQLIVDEHYAWQQGYGPIADGWEYVRRELPPDGTIAYANTFFVYPLQGPRLASRAVYAPVRPGIERISDLTPLPGRVSGEQIVAKTVHQTVSGADRDTWLANLSATGAEYLFVAKAGDTAPELDFAETSGFLVLFDNPAARIYRIDNRPPRQGSR